MSGKLAHPDMGKARETKSSINRPRPENYVVEDATGAGFDDQLRQFESNHVETGMDTVAPPPVQKSKVTKDLEKLIFIGKLTETIKVGGVEFEISTLTNKEHNEIIHMMYSFTDPADLFTIRLITMANAIKTIDGVSLDDFNIEGDFDSSLRRRMSIIDHLQLSVLEKLYEVYERLTSETDEAADQDKEVKNS